MMVHVLCDTGKGIEEIFSYLDLSVDEVNEILNK